MSKEKIICAAIHYYGDLPESGICPKTSNIDHGFVVTGYRHDRCVHTLSLMGLDTFSEHHTQGFLTSKDRFLNRNEAAKLAYESGQWSINGGPG